MRSLQNTRVAFIYTACLMLACFVPFTAYANESVVGETVPVAETQEQTTELPPSTTTEPATEPVPEETFTYDAATERWNSNVWQYDPTSNTYVPTPQPATTEQQTAPIEDKDALKILAPESTATSSQTTATTSAITNALDSFATSGDAGVLSNGSGGSALTGDASSIATIINNVNSTVTNANNQDAAMFVSDVMGDVNGDILLQPMLLKAMLEASAQTTQSSQQVSNTTAITNDINLGAQSGDANVESNTSAGNATTGTANTVADVVNLVNSMVAANQSFVGTINIYGNLNGDILIAPDFIPQLIASNSESGSDVSATKVSASDTQTIVNNVALAAESGAALVTNNTSAGNATTGSADTNLVIFNLSGHEIVASNSLLVFVNVLGTWVGVIVDAPVGATAAAIADGVTTNNKVDPSLEVDVVNETALTNNINLSSKSGDATIRSNTLAGNATSGNATASASIANIANSQLGLAGWFGVLFINVFGSWTGSFGIDTAAGNPLAEYSQSTDTASPATDYPLKVMSFIPRSSQADSSRANVTVIDPSGLVEPEPSAPMVKEASATSTTQSNDSNSIATDIPSQQDYIDARSVNYPLALVSLVVMGISIYGLRRILF